MEITQLKNTLLSLCPNILYQWLPYGKIDGKEYKCGDLTGTRGNSLSINTNTGIWKDFATGTGGDLISLYAGVKGISNSDAVRQLIEIYGNTPAIPQKPKPPEVKIIQPAPRPASDSEFNHIKHGKPSKTWCYKNSAGEIMGYVCRFDLPDGKETLPLVFTEKGYRWKGFPKPRPIYNLDKLCNKPILIVEGEKCAEIAQSTLKGFTSVSWLGGSQGYSYTDWQPLAGRDVIIWPDRDLKKYQGNHPKAGQIMEYSEQPGTVVANNIAKILADLDCKVRIIDVSNEKVIDGWDIADAVNEGWNSKQIVEWAKQRVKTYEKPVEIQQEFSQEIPAHYFEEPQQQAVGGSNIVSFPPQKTKKSTPEKQPPHPIYQGEDAWKGELRFKNFVDIVPKSLHNAKVILRDHPKMKGVFALNEFTQSIEILKSPPWHRNTNNFKRRALQDFDATDAKSWLELEGVTVSITEAWAAITSISQDNKIHPLKDYLSSITWDGVSRLDSWMISAYGAKNNEYSQFIGRKFLIGAVARALDAGCKMDTMLVLEGLQGKGKSKSVRELFSEKFYTDEIHGVGTKDTSLQMLGRWGIEIAELDVLEKSEVNAIKAWIARQSDKFRPPYGRSVVEQPRGCVFIGTVNPNGVGYLKDSTGGRRFWPVFCQRVDLDFIISHRDQLWAEATTLYNQEEIWWLTDEEEEIAKLEQRDRYEEDAWQELIEKFIEFKRVVTINQVLNECLEIPKERWNFHKKKVAAILQVLNWSKRRMQAEGERSYYYENPSHDNSNKQLDLIPY